MSGVRIPRRTAASNAPGGASGATTRAAAVPRGLLIIVGLAAALGAALGIRAFSTVVGPLFLAVVLSIIVHPLRRLSSRFRLPAWVGMALSLIAVYDMPQSTRGQVRRLLVSAVRWRDILIRL